MFSSDLARLISSDCARAGRWLAVGALGFMLQAHAAVPVMSCGQMAKLVLPQASITVAEAVTPGGSAMAAPPPRSGDEPGGGNVAGHIVAGGTPGFCRIAATLRPSSDSDIKIEVWLPLSGWNGKFLSIGNGGWAGTIPYSGLSTAIEEGYATAGTDTGHDAKTYGMGAEFVPGHPEKFIDYAYRADHLMTVDAKSIIAAFYGIAPSHSYWIGCSLGGLEALIEAKRFPADYDGIVAGAPPNPLDNFNAVQLWPGLLVSRDPSRQIPDAKYAMIHRAVMKICASPVGQQQGFVDKPESCAFDPEQLLCKGADAPDCLTVPQVYLLQQTYIGPTNPRTKALIFPGPARGAELELPPFSSNVPFPNAVNLFQYAVYQDPTWNWRTMDLDAAMAASVAKIGPLIHVDSDLAPFFDHGGKLLLYIGWYDYHNPQQLIEYYKSLMRDSGARAQASARLFTIPGMNHCFGGAGCDTFNKLGVIDAWVDQHVVPERVVAAKEENGAVVRTRPICAYPEVARYNGSGDIRNAASFVCATE